MIIGIDAGGTNTDGVLLTDKGIESEVKVPSTPNSVEGIREVLSSLIEDSEANQENIDRIVIGTTLILNSILEGKTGKCGCILMPGPGLNPKLAKNGEVNEIVEGYIDHRGRKVENLDEDVVREFEERHGDELESYAIVGKFSVRNPELENRVSEILGEKTIAKGNEVSSELSFPVRSSSTVLNSKSKPIFKKFTRNMSDVLEELGIEAPLYFIKSDGAMLSKETASRIPSLTVKSGPAVSTLGLYALTDAENALTIDIGGTTTDIGIIADGEPSLEEKLKIADYETFFSSIKSIDIPIGGDSLVEIESGEIKIRHERRGQAAAFGGDFPTLTDALHVLDEFSLGDTKKSEKVLSNLSEKSGHKLEELSRRIVQKFIKNISQSTREFINNYESLEDGDEITILGGGVLSDFLIPRIARKLEKTYKIPNHAKVAGAVGCAVSRVSINTGIHIDTEQGKMTVNGVQKDVVTGKRFSRDEILDIAGEEIERVSKEAGGSSISEQEIQIKNLRSFNIVEGGRVAGQITDLEGHVKPGISLDIDLDKIRGRPE